MVTKAGLAEEFHIESAATSTEEIGNDVYPPAKRKLTEKGIAFTRRSARQMTRRDYAEYDYLVGMDSANIRNMRRIAGGDDEGKISLLLDHSGSGRDVADPWYTGDFEATYRDVTEGCRALLKKITCDK